MSNRVELMNLFWTSSGMFPGEGEICRFDFRDRVEAAARAGFKGVGLWHTDLEHCTVHRSLKEMKQILDDNGMKHLELEFLTDWFTNGQRKAESDSRRKRLLEASAALDATHIKIGDFYNLPCDLPAVADSFAGLCRDAAEYGATIGFEIMPCAMIDNLKGAVEMVRRAGAANGGIILDIVDVVLLGMTHPEIAAVPPGYIVGVELNDGFPPGSPRYGPSGSRELCGEGEYDVKGFIRCMIEWGFRGPWSVEVISKTLCRRPLDEMNRLAYETTMRQFEEQ